MALSRRWNRQPGWCWRLLSAAGTAGATISANAAALTGNNSASSAPPNADTLSLIKEFEGFEPAPAPDPIEHRSSSGIRRTDVVDCLHAAIGGTVNDNQFGALTAIIVHARMQIRSHARNCRSSIRLAAEGVGWVDEEESGGDRVIPDSVEYGCTSSVLGADQMG
ncbi:hypothetical protein NLJ89_g11207 [Agrocybe chaxingu]|uniref:Uncharacterized protein n=1 Tax=Agrocybe chaxingu TaxID=84603 RepID=A0A9W8JP57_9AGAR|nr:hypothetical protein NLJ89_g11207 [Agrocybe chaxingu]